MKIGIIGAGRIGGTLARRFVDAGNDVMISNSRGPETLTGVVEELGDHAQAGTREEAARFGEIVLVAIPFRDYRQVPSDAVVGKIVIDADNYYPQRDGNFEDLDNGRTTSSELLQAHLPGAHVVKAFNSILWTVLRDEGRPAGDRSRLGIPISGDDDEAKRTVAGLIDEIGFDAVDAGSLAVGGRKHQAGAPLYPTHLPTAELQARLGAVAA
jgi:predicted dinucleotide-binding enzyme